MQLRGAEQRGGVRALVRTPCTALATSCELTHLNREPIDFEKARAQHAEYVAALRDCGMEVEVLSALDGWPDSTFVEDAALIFDELSITTRPGAPTRAGEVDLLRPHLPSDRPILELDLDCRLDGGDVLVLGRRVLAGLSTRTTEDGVAALARLLQPYGYSVHSVPVRGALHLKTAVTAVDAGLVVGLSDAVDLSLVQSLLGCEQVVHPPADEPAGANVLALPDTASPTVLVPASAPRTAELLTRAGRAVRTVDIGEFKKAEAGLTCLSLVWREAAGA